MRSRVLAYAFGATVLASAACAAPLQKIPYVLPPGAAVDVLDGAVRAACAKDLRSFCAVAQPAGRVEDCVARHMTVLQPACRAAIEQTGLAASSGKNGQLACSAHRRCVHEVTLSCPGAPAKHGSMAECLDQPSADLHPAGRSTAESPGTRQPSL